MGKNCSASAGDSGSAPDLGRSHMPRSSRALVLQLLGPAKPQQEKHGDKSGRRNEEAPRAKTRESPRQQ